MKKVVILYGSSTGNTSSVASQIADKLTGCETSVVDVAKTKGTEFSNFDNLILGCSTWGIGDLQDDWESFLPVLKKANLEGKVVALFGLGDSGSYPDSFVDGMGQIYEVIADKACQFTGSTSADAYSFSDSKALVNGIFVGLPIDEDNESNLTDERISAWVEKITPDFK